MTNLERFNEAFGHMEHRVMGRRLCKFTLRHRFWLEAMESPLVTGGKVTLLDLELATRVCAIRCGDLEWKLPRLISRGPGWLARLGWTLRAWRMEAGREYRLFQAYLLDHGCPPETWEAEVVCEGEGEPADESCLPGVLGLVTGLMRGACWEPETVWALAPGEAEWYLAGVFHHRGVDVGLKSNADEAMERMLRERLARTGSMTLNAEEKGTANPANPADK